MQLEMNVERITPKDAVRYLEANRRNRNLSPKLVSVYADAIRAGDWALNGESIKFSRRGHLIDGQHRLTAIIEANKPIKTVVVRDLHTKSFETIDAGKNRSVGDVLSIDGTKNPHNVSATARMLYLTRQGVVTPDMTGRHFKVPRTEVLEVAREIGPTYSDIYRPISRAKLGRLMSMSAAIALILYAEEIEFTNRDIGIDFFEQVGSGELNEDFDISEHPAHVLREKLFSFRTSKTQRHSPAYIYSIAALAFKRYITDEAKKSLQLRHDSRFALYTV